MCIAQSSANRLLGGMNTNLANPKITYQFKAIIWKHSDVGGWYFVSLPIELSQEIRTNLGWQEEGWGRMKAIATIRDTQWETAIWFDKKHNTYLLPIKSAIRKSESLDINDSVDLTIEI